MARTSPFRFVSSNRSGQYSVWRGEEQIGYVTKIVHRHVGLTRSAVAWTPSTLDRRDLATAKTRPAAARALWIAHQGSR
jgi:hypothetical protein